MKNDSHCSRCCMTCELPDAINKAVDILSEKLYPFNDDDKDRIKDALEALNGANDEQH